VIGSVALTPYRRLRSARVAAKDTRRPSAIPAAASREPLAYDHPQHRAGSRSEREADPDLVRPLRHAESDDSVDAERSEGERHRAEEREQEQRIPVARGRVVKDRRIGPHRHERERRVQRLKRAPHGGRHRHRIGGSGLHEQVHPRESLLQGAQVDARLRGPAEAEFAGVRDDADDLVAPIGRRLSEAAEQAIDAELQSQALSDRA